MPQKVKFIMYEVFYYDGSTTHRIMSAPQLKQFRKTKTYKQDVATCKPFKKVIIELTIQLRDI